MHNSTDRGQLFLPFATLSGFEALVKAQTQVCEQRRARSDEENEALSQCMLSLKKGMRVRVTWYADGCYRTCCGTVRQAEPANRQLILYETALAFDDIYAVEPIDAPGDM